MNKFVSRKKIIDSFLFFNEFNIIKLRLNYLKDVVDYFVICESNVTYSGNLKPYYLDEIIESFDENIRKKIIRLKHEVNPDYCQNSHWHLEHNQREFICKNLSSFSSNDLIMISDVDEIPKKEVIENFINLPNDIFSLKYDAFIYNFNTFKSNDWYGTVVCNVEKCIKIGSQKLRDDRNKFKVIENAGWHFTYFGDFESIKLKIESFSHYEVNDEKYKNKSNILSSIENKVAYWDTSIRYNEYNFNNFPENLKKEIIKTFPKLYYKSNFDLETNNRFLYLNLLKKSVTDALYDHELSGEKYLDGVSVTDDCLSITRRSQTMIGLRRLDNIQFCFENIVKENIPGDLIETGVWRGGSTIFMAGLVKSYNQNRKVYVADSFEGLPYPNVEKYPDDEGDGHFYCDYMKISLEEVYDNFKAYDLLNDNIVFLRGWFENTLPTIKNETFSLIRLDGDMYGSTWDALENLYPSLSVGGYLIVDDWALPNAKKSVTDYRNKYNILDEIVDINGHSVFWRKTNV